LAGLNRKKERTGDRALLDEVFDRCLVATVSTVLGDEPWAIPTLVVRDNDRLLLHGSTGAGALGHLAAGAKVTVSAFILDALVVAERQFEHSANYRSAVVRGTCRVLGDDEIAAALDCFTDAIIVGRPQECPPHSRKELAQTVLLELPIGDENWLTKQRSGPPSSPSAQWTGIIPVAQTYLPAVSSSTEPVPASVTRFLEDRNS
jgi:nitroimidazol reductase NimA-like FMN-containing flavoprotein (pyridoxamine 5'-phosphate oxidase superfamily)